MRADILPLAFGWSLAKRPKDDEQRYENITIATAQHPRLT
jgi:hypothetical protein